MSLPDRFNAAVTPLESDEDRLEARTRATEAAVPGDLLDHILQHHMDIEDAFEDTKRANEPSDRIAALRQLGILLTGHSIAEESVIYPALARDGKETHAAMAYDEQAMVKVQLATLETLDPMSQEFADTLDHIQNVVAHHMYSEEGDWFLDLKARTTVDDQARLTRRYTEEYARYVGADAAS